MSAFALVVVGWLVAAPVVSPPEVSSRLRQPLGCGMGDVR